VRAVHALAPAPMPPGAATRQRCTFTERDDEDRADSTARESEADSFEDDTSDIDDAALEDRSPAASGALLDPGPDDTSAAMKAAAAAAEGLATAKLCLKGLVAHCSKKHSAHWPALIEAGALGALRWALSCPQLVAVFAQPSAAELAAAAANGAPLVNGILKRASPAVHNLSLAFCARLLTPARTAALLDILRLLLEQSAASTAAANAAAEAAAVAAAAAAGCEDVVFTTVSPDYTVQFHCAAALAHATDCAPLHALESCGVTSLLTQLSAAMRLRAGSTRISSVPPGRTSNAPLRISTAAAGAATDATATAAAAAAVIRQSTVSSTCSISSAAAAAAAAAADAATAAATAAALAADDSSVEASDETELDGDDSDQDDEHDTDSQDELFPEQRGTDASGAAIAGRRGATAAQVADMAVYSLSKLCARNFMPSGGNLVPTLSRMVSLAPCSLLDCLTGHRLLTVQLSVLRL
jgi:trimeric autotransporter adhesin